jgi:serum/glucocorticoid-regulated kinase 2
VEYIHKKRIFHRDIKPENLVFDELGYLRLTDFGIARAEHSKQSLDASGTPGYMAPEVLCKQMHSFEVDFYAIGIIAHELMLGKVLLRTFSGRIRAPTASKSARPSSPNST